MPAQENETGNVLPIEEIRRRYDSEWLLIVEPETDQNHNVIRGRVLWHSKDRDEVYRKGKELELSISAYLYTGSPPSDTEFAL